MSQSYHLSIQEEFVEELVETGQENVILNFPSTKILGYLKEVLTEHQQWSGSDGNSFRRVEGDLAIDLRVDQDDRVVHVNHTVQGTFGSSLRDRYREILNEAFDLACTHAIVQAARLLGEVKVTPGEYNKAVHVNQMKVEVFAY